MNDWFSWYTLIAFILGVMLSAMVKGAAGNLRSRATGG